MKTKNRPAVALSALAVVCITTGYMMTSSAESRAASSDPQNMIGRWDGFIAVMGDPPDPVRTEITSQVNRRFIGTNSPPDPVQPISIEGTVSASGKVNYQGQSPDGTHLVGKTDLTDFGGGAAILNGSVTRFAPDGTFIVPCVLVLRPFAAEPPDPVYPAGQFLGTLSADGVSGQVNLLLNDPPDPVRPTSFAGNMSITIGGQTHVFPLIATGDGQGRLVAIGHATSGHLIINAVLASPPEPVQPPTLNGSFTIEFADGSEHEGTFQTTLFRSTNS